MNLEIDPNFNDCHSLTEKKNPKVKYIVFTLATLIGFQCKAEVQTSLSVSIKNTLGMVTGHFINYIYSILKSDNAHPFYY